MEKAYIFTLDAIIAAAALTVMMTSMYFMLGEMNPTTPDSKYLAATDSLSTLDLAGDLEKSIEESSETKLQEYLDHAMQPQFCGEIKVRNKSGSVILSARKEGCTAGEEDLTIARRMLMVKGDPYTAKMGVWGA